MTRDASRSAGRLVGIATVAVGATIFATHSAAAGGPNFGCGPHGSAVVVPHCRPCLPPPILRYGWLGGGPVFPGVAFGSIPNAFVAPSPTVVAPPAPPKVSRLRQARPRQSTDDKSPFVGLWTAKTESNALIRLGLRRDRTFVWIVVAGNETTEFRGRYSTPNGRLVLVRDDDGEILEGDVEGGSAFQFQLALGESDSAPAALRFAR